jgi:hypothetical protein
VIKTRIKFDLEDHGWFDIYISDKGNDLTISASYLSDSIEEMIIRLCIFIESKSDIVIKFQGEPGEYRFILKHNGTNCLFEIYEFRDTFSKQDIQNGVCIISSEIEIDKLVNLFYKEIEKLYEMGPNEYKKRWGYNFPQDAFHRMIKAKEVMMKK